MATWEVDVGLSLLNMNDSELETPIMLEAAKLNLHSPSSGAGWGVRDMQFLTTDSRSAQAFADWVESKIQDENSYVGVSKVPNRLGFYLRYWRDEILLKLGRPPWGMRVK